MEVALVKIEENTSRIEIYEIEDEELDKLLSNPPNITHIDGWWLATYTIENGKLVKVIKPEYIILETKTVEYKLLRGE